MKRLFTLLMILASVSLFGQKKIVMQFDIEEPTKIVGLTNGDRYDRLENGSLVLVAPEQTVPEVKHVLLVELLESKRMIIVEIVQRTVHEWSVVQPYVYFPETSGRYEFNDFSRKMTFVASEEPIDDFIKGNGNYYYYDRAQVTEEQNEIHKAMVDV